MPKKGKRSVFLMATEAGKRKMGARAQRRRAEAEARKQQQRGKA